MNQNEALALSQMSRAQGMLVGIVDALTISMNYDTRDAVNERVKDAEVLWHDGAGLLLAQLSNPRAAERIRAICNTAQPSASVGPDGERCQELSRSSVMQLEAIADELEGAGHE